MCRNLDEPKTDDQKVIRKKHAAKKSTDAPAKEPATPHADHANNADLSAHTTHTVHCDHTDALTALEQFSGAVLS